MNLRQFSMAILISSLPLQAGAASKLSFSKGDFLSAERVSQEGRALVRVKLSKSGKAKLKKINARYVGQAVHTDVGGVSSDFVLREPIRGDGLEMGPYAAAEAEKIVEVINQR